MSRERVVGRKNRGGGCERLSTACGLEIRYPHSNSEIEFNSLQMVQLRDSAFERAFEDGYFKSPRASTTMDSPRYMAKILGSPMKYMWLSRVITTTGRLDEKGKIRVRYLEF
ncbi:unnamed protein product [Hymenolepis diminuta]|uniref:Uncharacterized protein n=1 Tax=Hymenolepis diminuta TaxID=6216 RepID=A0A564ZA40_HYMDI|nr:unnamed protein product [Hymenolepis diminuta]